MGIGRDIAFSTALIVSFQIIARARASLAAFIVVAQSEPTQAGGTVADSNAAHEKSPPEFPGGRESIKSKSRRQSRLGRPRMLDAICRCENFGEIERPQAERFSPRSVWGKGYQAVFPAAIAPKYSGETPDKARTLTCAEQFTANKATNGNGSLKWIDKDGGYYGECVSRLKG